MSLRAQAGSDDSSDDDEEEESSGSGSGSESEDSEDDANHKAKGVQGLIEIENPNRVVKKSAEKVTKVDVNAAGSSKPELSRREREEVERQRAQANYQKLHAEGKTEQARADLARLAIIKQVTTCSVCGAMCASLESGCVCNAKWCVCIFDLISASRRGRGPTRSHEKTGHHQKRINNSGIIHAKQQSRTPKIHAH